MGWAGPAQPTGPDSAQNCWADFGPKWIGPISAQKKTLLGQTRLVRPTRLGRTQSKIVGPSSAQNKNSSGPDPAQKTRLGQDPPGPATKTGGGNYFPPPRPCMQNANRSACREEKKK